MKKHWKVQIIQVEDFGSDGMDWKQSTYQEGMLNKLEIGISII